MTRIMLGKAQEPSVEHPWGVAVCGTPIKPGLVVWTNEYRAGVVEDRPLSAGEWFNVRYADGTGALQNPERVTTVFEGEQAAEQLAADVAGLDTGVEP